MSLLKRITYFLIFLNITSLFAFTIERVSEDDFQNAKLVFMKAFSNAYRNVSLEELRINNLEEFLSSAFEDDFLDLVNRSPDSFFYQAKDDNGMIIGYVSFEIDESKTKAYIRQLAVHPDFQLKGVGKKLVFKICDEIETIQSLNLVTRKVNANAQEFCHHIGFCESSFAHQGYNPLVYIGLSWNKNSH